MRAGAAGHGSCRCAGTAGKPAYDCQQVPGLQVTRILSYKRGTCKGSLSGRSTRTLECPPDTSLIHQAHQLPCITGEWWWHTQCREVPLTSRTTRWASGVMSEWGGHVHRSCTPAPIHMQTLRDCCVLVVYCCLEAADSSSHMQNFTAGSCGPLVCTRMQGAPLNTALAPCDFGTPACIRTADHLQCLCLAMSQQW
jgi:hypothetical protein